MSLNRVGGKGDGGIDLQGWWWLPTRCLGHSGRAPAGLTTQGHEHGRVPVRVLAQCKAEEKRIGPRYIREFEGTILRFSACLPEDAALQNPPADSPKDIVGVLLSTSPFTQASLLQAYSSPVPIALIHLPEHTQVHVRPEQTTIREPLDDADGLGTLVFNPALGSATGLLRGSIEPRWERSRHWDRGRPALWSAGKRLGGWTPEDGDSDIWPL